MCVWREKLNNAFYNANGVYYRSYWMKTRKEVERMRWRKESESLATLKLDKEVKCTVIVSVSDKALSANP